jgi:hypothetical protein
VKVTSLRGYPVGSWQFRLGRGRAFTLRCALRATMEADIPRLERILRAGSLTPDEAGMEFDPDRFLAAQAEAIMGGVDARKRRSCVALFAAAAPDEPVFPAVLGRFFAGGPDPLTLGLLAEPGPLAEGGKGG